MNQVCPARIEISNKVKLIRDIFKISYGIKVILH